MATLRQVFHDIAEAIRSKGITGTFKPIDMASKIGEIQSGGSEPTNQKASFTYDSSSTIVVPKTLVVDMLAMTDLRYCFYNCSSLTSLVFPDGFGMNAVNLGGCFASCTSLTSLVLPDGFGMNAVSLSLGRVGCFYNCKALESLHLPSGFGQNSTSNGRCFSLCAALTTITGNPNFKATVDLTPCNKLTHDSLMVVINGLQTVTTTQTLSLGETNLAKLTDAEKQIATDKGWTLT